MHTTSMPRYGIAARCYRGLMENPTISTVTAATMLGVSRMTIHRWVCSGRLATTIDQNGHYRVSAAAAVLAAAGKHGRLA
jgi:excisionase family DNA binding protein